jgi:hypothetical protein
MPVIVFAGRICEQKRPTMLAEIFRVARDNHLIFRALVIGDGDQRGRLEALLSQYDLTATVQMLGSVPHQRWLDILVASDILLMPSQYEGISIALLEAMAAGVVPVVAKVGGQEEIVSQDAGVLIPHGDNELQQYLDVLKSLISDPARWLSMSRRCKALTTSKFSWEEMIDNFQALLDEAHQLMVDNTRLLITPRLGRELASLSLECKRLGEAVDWLWHSKRSSMMPDENPSSVSAESMAISRFAILLSQTRVGRAITRSRLVKSIARKVLIKMESSGSRNN